MLPIFNSKRPPWWKRALFHLSLVGFGVAISLSALQQAGVDIYVGDKVEAVVAGVTVVAGKAADQERLSKGPRVEQGRVANVVPPPSVEAACQKRHEQEDSLYAAARCLEEVFAIGEKEVLERKKVVDERT